MSATALSAFLVALVGGGGIVPFLWRWWVRRHPRPVESGRAKAEIEAISTHAARETVEAMQGVMLALRRQAEDRGAESDELRAQQARDREEIRKLRAKIDELVSEVRRLGGTVEGLEPGVA